MQYQINRFFIFINTFPRIEIAWTSFVGKYEISFIYTDISDKRVGRWYGVSSLSSCCLPTGKFLAKAGKDPRPLSSLSSSLYYYARGETIDHCQLKVNCNRGWTKMIHTECVKSLASLSFPCTSKGLAYLSLSILIFNCKEASMNEKVSVFCLT